MSSFFCLCTTKGIIREYRTEYKVADDSNVIINLLAKQIEGILPPERSMECVKVGVRQFLADKPNIDENVQVGDSVREHFPNVDIFMCKDCGAGFVR